MSFAEISLPLLRQNFLRKPGMTAQTSFRLKPSVDYSRKSKHMKLDVDSAAKLLLSSSVMTSSKQEVIRLSDSLGSGTMQYYRTRKS
jgi:hypothetical protein